MNGRRMRRSRPLLLWAIVLLSACDRRDPSSHEQAKAAAPPATVAVATSTAVPDDALLVLPGDYAQSTTLAELEARFGKGSLRFEGPPDYGVVLFPEDPSRRAFLSFHNAEAHTDLASISVRDAGSRWRGKQGLQVGTSFAKLRELNGKPFYLMAFENGRKAWAHGQWSPSMSDEDSALGKFDVEEGDHMYFDVDLGLRDPAAASPLADPASESPISSDDADAWNAAERFVVTSFGASTSLDDEWQ